MDYVCAISMYIKMYTGASDINRNKAQFTINVFTVIVVIAMSSSSSSSSSSSGCGGGSSNGGSGGGGGGGSNMMVMMVMMMMVTMMRMRVMNIALKKRCHVSLSNSCALSHFF